MNLALINIRFHISTRELITRVFCEVRLFLADPQCAVMPQCAIFSKADRLSFIFLSLLVINESSLNEFPSLNKNHSIKKFVS